MITKEQLSKIRSDAAKLSYLNGRIHPNLGKHLSAITKKRQSRARLKFYKNGGIHPNTGKKFSEKRKKEMSVLNSGDKNPNWNGGVVKTKIGYLFEYCPNSKRSNGGTINHVLQHRLVMARHIGRDLLSSEVVHHINGIKDDNRIENLVITTASKHVSGHNSERVWKESSKNKQRIKAEKMRDKNSGRFINLTK